MVKLLIVCSIVLALGLLLQFPVYYVRQQGTVSDLLWNADECYLFLGVSRAGWYGSVLQDIGVTFKAYVGGFGGVTRPRTMVNDIFVWHFRANGMQRFTVPDTAMGSPEVFEGHIYTRIGDFLLRGSSVLVRWANGTFQAVEGEEAARFSAANRVKGGVLGGNFTTVAGWSQLTGILSRSLDGHSTFVVPLQQQDLSFHVRKNDEGPLIVLQTPSHPPEQLWALDTRPRRVSHREYTAFLQSRRPSP